MARIAIFASGSGTNFEKLVINAKEYEVAFLFCDRKDAFVIERAKKLNTPCEYLSIIKEKENFDIKLLALLEKYNIDFIVLAGYMKLISKTILEKWSRKIINIHPSLLPKFPGKDAIKQTWESNEEYGGISIHFVDEGMDTGQIIKQASTLVDKEKNYEEFEKSIHELEYEWYPKIINKIAKEKLWKEH